MPLVGKHPYPQKAKICTKNLAHHESSLLSKYDNVCTYLKARSSDLRHHYPKSRSCLDTLIATRLPTTHEEMPVALDTYDKIFCSQWLNKSQIIVGTKCNKLLVLEPGTSRVVEIPYLSLFMGSSPPSSPFKSSGMPRSRTTTASGSTSTTTRWPHPSAGGNLHLGCVGIHSIVVNPSKTLMAIGAGKPYEIVIYDLPSMEPRYLLTGHSDLVFSLQFVSDDVLLSGSRDGTVGVFSLRSSPTEYFDIGMSMLPVLRPMVLRREHADRTKVRDIKYNQAANQLLSLGTDRTVKLWDVNQMQVVQSTTLEYGHESVCLGIDSTRHICSVGSSSHVTLLDSRDVSMVHAFTSKDAGSGVRSLAHSRNTVACGGGMGRISFFDVDAMAYVEVRERHDHWSPTAHRESEPVSASVRSASRQQPGSVPFQLWIGGENTFSDDTDIAFDNEAVLRRESDTFLQSTPPAGIRGPTPVHFISSPRNAIYTLSYNEDHSRLFAGGGPLQLGLSACYAALW